MHKQHNGTSYTGEYLIVQMWNKPHECHIISQARIINQLYSKNSSHSVTSKKAI